MVKRSEDVDTVYKLNKVEETMGEWSNSFDPIVTDELVDVILSHSVIYL